MGAFKFRLQKLLDIRMEKEEESKRELKKAQNERNIVLNKLDDLEGHYRKYNKTDIKATIIQNKIKFNYLNALSRNIEETKKELNIKEENVKNKLEKVKVCQIERKTVEKLKEKSKEAFIKEMNLKEQKTNDELALYGYIRKLKGGEKDAG